MTTKSFFKWVIMPRDEWRKLIADRSELNSLQLRYAQRVEIESDLRKQLAKYEGQERGEGLHCQSCSNAIEVQNVMYVTDEGIRKYDDVVCALNVPCAKFERKG